MSNVPAASGFLHTWSCLRVSRLAGHTVYWISKHLCSPGVKRSTDEFYKEKPEKVSVLYAHEYSNGYFRKL